jgi:hypothetical protein
MISKITTEKLRGRFDCFSHFNRNDRVCLKHCALNIRCALAKREWFDQEAPEDWTYPPMPLDGDFDLGQG